MLYTDESLYTDEQLNDFHLKLAKSKNISTIFQRPNILHFPHFLFAQIFPKLIVIFWVRISFFFKFLALLYP